MRATVEQAQSFQGQQRFHLLNGQGFRCDDGAQPTGRDDEGLTSEFLFNAPHEGINQACVAEQQTGLDARRRIRSDDGLRLRQLHFG